MSPLFSAKKRPGTIEAKYFYLTDRQSRVLLVWNALWVGFYDSK